MEKENIKSVGIIIAIIIISIIAAFAMAYAENRSYGWKVDNAIECCGAYHKSVSVLPPGANISVLSPVNLIVNGENHGRFEGGLINLPLGKHELIINGDNLNVYVVASEKEVPGFEFIPAILIIFFMVRVIRKNKVTGG